MHGHMNVKNRFSCFPYVWASLHSAPHTVIKKKLHRYLTELLPAPSVIMTIYVN